MGAPSKKEKAAEIALSVAESFQRMALGFLPGGHLVEEFLNFRGTLKQQRILSFSESVKEAFENLADIEINPSNFTTEEFVDVFDAVITKVQTTRSKVKLDCLKGIIVNQAINNSSANEVLSQKIIQTIEELNEVQLMILIVIGRHSYFPTIYDIHMNFDSNIYIRLDEADELPLDISPEQVISVSIFLHFLDELVNKGLLREREIDGSANLPLREMSIYEGYMNSKRRMSNTRITYERSAYSDLVCSFISLS
jgi:hypothetical protein